MPGLTFLLDTNVFADLLWPRLEIRHKLQAAYDDGDVFILCQPVRFEVLRGLQANNAIRKQRMFVGEFVPLLTRVSLDDTDWQNAGTLWAQAKNQERRLSDIDFLIAALCQRHGYTFVTADEDFSIFNIARVNWRAA